MTREEALSLMYEKIQNINLRRHMLATEAVMRALAEKLGCDGELWGLTGLLHDIDLEAVNQDMSRHAALTGDWLEGRIPAEAVTAIRAHNGENLGLTRSTDLDHALAAGETLTGMIVAATLVLPSKKIADLKAKSVLKRMKEPRFAAGANREVIRECEGIGIALDQFVEIAVLAMRGIGGDLGL